MSIFSTYIYIYISYSNLNIRIDHYKMTHPHKIDYYQFPAIIKPVYKPDDYRVELIVEPENTEKEWWEDDEDE